MKYLPLLAATMLTCCGSPEPPVSPEKMVQVLADYSLAAAAASTPLPGANTATQDSVRAQAYLSVLAHHQLTEKEFLAAWDAYSADVPKMKHLMNKLLEELTTRQAKAQGTFTPYEPERPRGLNKPLKQPTP